MKRSEMIEVIKDYLDLREEDPRTHPDSLDAAEYILGCCETWGMLPPYYIDSESQALDPRVFDWKPEDE